MSFNDEVCAYHFQENFDVVEENYTCSYSYEPTYESFGMSQGDLIEGFDCAGGTKDGCSSNTKCPPQQAKNGRCIKQKDCVACPPPSQ